jgi:hypothetical protein
MLYAKVKYLGLSLTALRLRQHGTLSLVCHFFALRGEKNDTQGIKYDEQAKVLIRLLAAKLPAFRI